jgi:hypothetical protein
MNDLRFAIRSLRRSPGFVFIAVVTLGLGIGANTSMFSVINGYMLRPSPYPDSDHLDRIYRTTPRNSQGDISAADYVDLKSQMNGYGEIALGIYGVIARTMAQRTSEFGIRLALGAQAGDITRLVLASGAKLALVGSALGLLGAFGISRLIAAFFPGLQTGSVAVLTGVTLLLVAIAQIAGYIPARNASRISPTEALRAE